MKVDAPTGPSSPLNPARWASAAGLHYGWVVVAVCFVLLLASAGVRSAPGVLIKPLEADFGWSRGDISWALAVSLLTLGFAGPISGAIMNRWGMRRMAVGFLALGALGVAATAATQSILGLYLSWGILVGFGTGGVSTVMSAAVANTWFESRRGLVTGILEGRRARASSSSSSRSSGQRTPTAGAPRSW